MLEGATFCPGSHPLHPMTLWSSFTSTRKTAHGRAIVGPKVITILPTVSQVFVRERLTKYDLKLKVEAQEIGVLVTSHNAAPTITFRTLMVQVHHMQ